MIGSGDGGGVYDDARTSIFSGYSRSLDCCRDRSNPDISAGNRHCVGAKQRSFVQCRNAPATFATLGQMTAHGMTSLSAVKSGRGGGDGRVLSTDMVDGMVHR